MSTKLEKRNSKLVETKSETGSSKRAIPSKTSTKLVRDFTDLDAWKLARELRKATYLLTEKFPADEKYVLVAQLRRAAVSVTANIAEGFGRYSYRENLQYCRQARGSAYELRDHLSTALDAAYLSRDEWRKTDGLAQRVIQVLNGYIRSTQARQKSKAKV